MRTASVLGVLLACRVPRPLHMRHARVRAEREGLRRVPHTRAPTRCHSQSIARQRGVAGAPILGARPSPGSRVSRSIVLAFEGVLAYGCQTACGLRCRCWRPPLLTPARARPIAVRCKPCGRRGRTPQHQRGLNAHDRCCCRPNPPPSLVQAPQPQRGLNAHGRCCCRPHHTQHCASHTDTACVSHPQTLPLLLTPCCTLPTVPVPPACVATPTLHSGADLYGPSDRGFGSVSHADCTNQGRGPRRRPAHFPWSNPPRNSRPLIVPSHASRPLPSLPRLSCRCIL